MPLEPRPSGPLASARRIGAMILRYWYLLRSSWPRLLELIYWPAVQMLMWGFLQTYLHERTGILAAAAGALLGAVLLWDILFRGQIGFSISFLEEMWARNLGHLMISPLRTGEFVAALMAMSVIRVVIGLAPVTLMALIFFDFNIFKLGLALAGFFLVLIATSWAFGLVVCGLVLRQGLGAESLAWSLIFLLLPLACVYYPVSTLPEWLQYVSLSLPPTHVFEGMRAILIDGTFRPDLMLRGLALNVVYLLVGLAIFYALLRSARVHGSLLVSGE
ncbi:MAG TPA: ABC transporter permease [Hyphomicrobiales bacterium]|nr:ABC transporter permease [Hyphomicrobiales bacterium]